MPFDDEPLNVEELARLRHLDEQIDQGLHAQTRAHPNGKSALDPALLRDLQEVYQPRSQAFQNGLDRVWGRLEARGVTSAESDQPPAQPVPSAGAPQKRLRPVRPMRSAGRRWTSRLSVLIAAALLVALVGALAFGLVLVRRPSSTAATPTPVSSASVPSPMPSPSVTPTSVPGGVTQLTSIDMIDETTGWARALAGNDWRLLHTSDGGVHWQDVTPPTVFSVAAPLRAYYLNASIAWVVTEEGTTVFKTKNGGQSWQNAPLPTPIEVSQITFINAQDGWLLSTQGATGNEFTTLFRTTDGGISWTKIADSGTPPDTTGAIPLNGTNKKISFLNASTGWMAAFSNNNILWLYVTHDGGVTWQHQTLAMPPGVDVSVGPSAGQFTVYPPTFFNARDGILPVQVPNGAGTPAKTEVYVTHDGGGSWQLTPLVRGYADNVSFSDANHGWASGATTLFSTSDGGQHWTQLPLSSDFQPIQSLDFVSAQVGWMLVAPDDVLELLKTTDGGQSWAVVTPQIA